MSGLPPPDYTVNEDGERVIAASRRPDGTVRKERRVRAGYVPQDEQQVYVSRGTAMRQNVPKCPGFDESSAEPSKPKSKSAAKNAKRKEKRLVEQSAAGGAGGGSSGADAAAAGVQALSLGGGGGSAAQAPAAAAASAAAAAAAEEPSVEKQIRNLKKKMRQAEALAEKKAGGVGLSPEEEAKLSKLPGWQEELRQLEAQL